MNIQKILEKIMKMKFNKLSLTEFVKRNSNNVQRICQTISENLPKAEAHAFRSWARVTMGTLSKTKCMVLEGYIVDDNDNEYILEKGDVMLIDKKFNVSTGLMKAISKSAEKGGSSRICPKCGFTMPNYPGRYPKFCVQCGTALSPATESVFIKEIEEITTTRDIGEMSVKELLNMIPSGSYRGVKDGDITVIRDGTHTRTFVWEKGQPILKESNIVEAGGTYMSTSSLIDMNTEDVIAMLPEEIYANAENGEEFIIRDNSGTQIILIMSGGRLVVKTDNIKLPEDPDASSELSTAMANVEKVSDNLWKIFIDNGSVLECDSDGLYRFMQEKAIVPVNPREIKYKVTVRLKDRDIISFQEQDIKCPECGSTKVKKVEGGKEGKQKYKCEDCGHEFEK